MTNIVAVCAMYHLDEMERMLTIATSQAEDLGYNIVDVIRVPGCMEIPLALCLLYTSPSPRDRQKSRMPSSA